MSIFYNIGVDCRIMLSHIIHTELKGMPRGRETSDRWGKECFKYMFEAILYKDTARNYAFFIPVEDVHKQFTNYTTSNIQEQTNILREVGKIEYLKMVTAKEKYEKRNRRAV